VIRDLIDCIRELAGSNLALPQFFSSTSAAITDESPLWSSRGIRSKD
jgi:hypothetical protein